MTRKNPSPYIALPSKSKVVKCVESLGHALRDNAFPENLSSAKGIANA